MTRFAAVEAILQELYRAEGKHPVWPTDIVHAIALVCEESGEAQKAANNAYHHGESLEEVKKELLHTGATVIRALMNL